MTRPDVSIVVLSWNTRDLTTACLEALLRDGARPECQTTREIIVVDNGSEDGSADHVAAHFPQVRLIRNAENRLYAEGNNQGARAATGKWLCTLNSDTEVEPGALDLLVHFLAEHPDYGAASPRLVFPDGRLQRACRRFPNLLVPFAESTRLGHHWPLNQVNAHLRMDDFDHLSSRDVDQPPGAVMVFDRQEFVDMGGLDPELSLFFNDVDLCKRLWQTGRRIRYLAEAVVVHHEGASTSRVYNRNRNALYLRNRAAFFRKHYGPTGEHLMQGALALWTLEYALGVSLSPVLGMPEKAAELRALRDHVRTCMA